MHDTSSADELLAAVAARHEGTRGEVLRSFARTLLARASSSYFDSFHVDDLVDAVESCFEQLESNTGPEFSVRVENPTWLSRVAGGRAAIAVTGPDQPFLVDTLRELVRVKGLTVVELFHPILRVGRSPSGQVTSIKPAGNGSDGSDAELVSFTHLEIDHVLSPDECRDLEEEARIAFEEAQRATTDFRPMLVRLSEIIGHLTGHAEALGATEARAEIEEAAEFLQWLRRANFVFLGYREYDVLPGAKGRVATVTRGSGLGILRDDKRSDLLEPISVAELPEDARERIAGSRPLNVCKTDRESLVLRRARMDYIGVRKYDRDGSVRGECRFLGLFTSRALDDLPADIPVLRRKLERILSDCGAISGSHDHKEIFSIYCSLPKAELFVADVNALRETILSVLANRDRLDVRVSYRSDVLESGVSAMVLLPRDRFSVHNRQAIQDLLAQKFGGTLVDYRLALTNEPQARLHFYFACESAAGTPPAPPAPPLDELEASVAALTRTWDEDLLRALKLRNDIEDPVALAREYKGAFSATYRASEPAANAAADILELERARTSRTPRVVVRPDGSPRRDSTEIRILRAGGQYHLSELMPVLTNLGLDVWDELTYRVGRPGSSQGDHVHSFRVLSPEGRTIEPGEASERMADAILQVLQGRVADDALNALIVHSELDWRQVDLLRVYTWYHQQLEGTLRRYTAYCALCDHPRAAAALVDLFEARLDPDLDDTERVDRQAATAEAFARALDDVPGIHEDQVLRGYENLITATVRTNWYQREPDGEPRPAVAIKVRSEDVARMPAPRPLYEIFVASPNVEGIHLRSGKVARGGIRWSDRVDDFRTEILGLMKAQRTKNALIVPVGAKGGFVLVGTPPADAVAATVREQYEVFIGSLLDVTDNVVAGETIPPDRVVVHDEDDPYLVVAADRGTAQFSDVANGIARARSFWLDDAFASGGSSGYNHKTHGITARGTWECVKRHFREFGVDTQTEAFTVCGIGDMSGDVFGNGMLLSPEIRLIAAFNHRHVFLDPSPDPAVSFEERRRLFELSRSSWNDYDPKLISAGGGVWERSAKSIRLSPEARELLDIDTTALNGDELVHAVLQMPVGLLFNGGIGTYVKGTLETDVDVGDPANDAVRVDASELRARVIGEGGNLGLTQDARVEFARQRGAINTDFIDNSGGVDLSDREVNLKILLEQAIADGSLLGSDRDAVLDGVAVEVCEQVLRDNRQQSAALSIAERGGAERLDQIRMVIDELEATGLLDRAVESVPEDAELRKQRESGMNLTRPQLAVVLAYVKIDSFANVLSSGLARHGAMAVFLDEYFPRPVVERFPETIAAHSLRDEIIATAAVNACVNRMGLTFLHRLRRDTGESPDRILHAWLAADRSMRGDAFHAALDATYEAKALDCATLYDAMEQHAEAVERLTRWLLRRTVSINDLDEILSGHLAVTRTDPTLDEPAGVVDSDAKLPRDLAVHLAFARDATAGWISRKLGAETNRPPPEVTAALNLASDRLLLDRVGDEARRIVKLGADDWQMCAALTDRLEDVRFELAATLLRYATRSGPESEPVGLRTAAELLVPDDHPIRTRLQSSLDAVLAREPATPSGLFAFVADVERLVSDAATKLRA